MPCPYFYPVEHLNWANAPKLPLGDAYTGHCQADPAAPVQPEPLALREFCNLGYARRRCPRFPAEAGPDAVRFSITHDAGEFITLYWVREQDHHPFDHGPLEFSTKEQLFTTTPAGERLGQQAHAYVRSYLRRRFKAKR
jgi:hypothetical protein